METAKPDPIVLQCFYYELMPGLLKEKKISLAVAAVLGLGGAALLSRVETTRATRLFVGVAPAPLYLAWTFYRASREKRLQQEEALAYNQRGGSPEFKRAVDRALGPTQDDQLLQITRLRLARDRKQELLNERAKSLPLLKGIDAQAIVDNHPVSGEALSAAYVQSEFGKRGWTKELSSAVDPEVAVRAIQLLGRFKGSLPVLEYHLNDVGRTAELSQMEDEAFRPALELLRGGQAEGDKINPAQRRDAIEDGLFSHINRKGGKGFDDAKDFLTLESGVRRALFVSIWERVEEQGKRKILAEVRFLNSSPDQKFGERVNPLLLPSEITPLLSGYSYPVTADCTLFFRMKGWEIEFVIIQSERGIFRAALAGLIIDSEGVQTLRSNLAAYSRQLRPYAQAVQSRLIEKYGTEFELYDIIDALSLINSK